MGEDINELAQEFPSAFKSLLAQAGINKADLPAAWIGDVPAAVPLSAETGAGIDELCDRISRARTAGPVRAGRAAVGQPAAGARG